MQVGCSKAKNYLEIQIIQWATRSLRVRQELDSSVKGLEGEEGTCKQVVTNPRVSVERSLWRTGRREGFRKLRAYQLWPLGP